MTIEHFMWIIATLFIHGMILSGNGGKYHYYNNPDSTPIGVILMVMMLAPGVLLVFMGYAIRSIFSKRGQKKMIEHIAEMTYHFR